VSINDLVLRSKGESMARWRLVSIETGTILVVISCAALLAIRLQREPSEAGRPQDPGSDHVGELLSVDGASTKGNSNASVVLIVFTDYQCPFCAQFALKSLPRIVRGYVQDGRVRVAVLNSPIAAIHSMAMRAAEAGECAGQEGRFWEMHDLLFRNQASLSADRIDALWAEVGLDSGQLVACRIAGEMLAKVKRQSEVAREFDLKGTPTIAIGLAMGTVSRVLIRQRFDGVPPDNVLTAALEKALDGR
jgi:protein-disulfide isomerase